QYIAEAAGRDFSFVPIAMISENFKSAVAVGETIHKAVQESGKRVVVIASSDFTHAGSAYGFLPCPRNQLIDWMYEHDSLALDRIKELDVKGFIDVRNKHGLTICGSGPIGAMLHYARLSGAEEAKVLKYTTSYEASRSLSGVVGYASVVVE
ncbi:MAG: AmmeMemoRadiSam system protein B, partial [Thermoplasmata archaeon]|nr:AmmeMemoRadiSam system protein B [Thermoplasmata archaeon]